MKQLLENLKKLEQKRIELSKAYYAATCEAARAEIGHECRLIKFQVNEAKTDIRLAKLGA